MFMGFLVIFMLMKDLAPLASCIVLHGDKRLPCHLGKWMVKISEVKYC